MHVLKRVPKINFDSVQVVHSERITVVYIHTIINN